MSKKVFEMNGQKWEEDAHRTNPSLPRDAIFYLWRNPYERRYQFNDYALHCGDCFEALIDGKWIRTRIEHNDGSVHSYGWFLVTHPDLCLRDLPVRKNQ